MMNMPLPTDFAPAERAPDDILVRDSHRFLEDQQLQLLLNAVPDVFMILNPERQIVFANQAMVQFLALPELGPLVGRRPGEALRCDHALAEGGGCGTTEFCRTCGAIRAILGSQKGRVQVEECHIAQANHDALDLRVRATPLDLGQRRFTLFAVQDISHEKRRHVLERIFFHDILNTAGGVLGLADILSDADPDEVNELVQDVRDLADQLVDEIKAQQILLAAESGELAVVPKPVEAGAILESIRAAYAAHEVTAGRILVVDAPATPRPLTTDPVLLRRVLGNMVKNALEASAPGQTVTLACRATADGVEFSVHNMTVMPRVVQLQIFQRSFTSKGSGRGLGTYSMKLLTERYLQGRVGFTSTPATGTHFTAWVPWALSTPQPA